MSYFPDVISFLHADQSITEPSIKVVIENVQESATPRNTDSHPSLKQRLASSEKHLGSIMLSLLISIIQLFHLAKNFRYVNTYLIWKLSGTKKKTIYEYQRFILIICKSFEEGN